MLCDEQGLGDVVSKALELIGVTEQRVVDWMGDCKCKERREKLNQLGNWATRVVMGRVKDARRYLDDILYHEN